VQLAGCTVVLLRTDRQSSFGFAAGLSIMWVTAAKDEEFRLTETRGLKWYRSSDTGRRGFCEQCGSVLFWKGDGYDYIAIAAGSIDGKLGVTLDGHIFCDSAGDYYQFTGRRLAPLELPKLAHRLCRSEPSALVRSGGSNGSSTRLLASVVFVGPCD
jgi:Glutathione-dependent formaldehyde-activating enzyme